MELGLEIEKESGTFGAAPKSKNEYIRSGLERIREILCPRCAEILKTPGVDVAVVIIDTICRHYNIPSLVSVSKKIADIGLAAFCADPHGTLGRAAGV
jgi:hypothetical protein